MYKHTHTSTIYKTLCNLPMASYTGVKLVRNGGGKKKHSLVLLKHISQKYCVLINNKS